jgi:hypothetical protein
VRDFVLTRKKSSQIKINLNLILNLFHLKVMRNPHVLRIAAGMLAVTTLLTTACKDETAAVVTPVYAKAQFIHVAPEAPGVIVSVDGKNINTDSLRYLQVLRVASDSTYLDVDVTAAGKRVIKLDSKTGNVVTDSVALNKDVHYSFFAYTDTVTAKTKQVLASDNLATPSTGKVKLRVAHFISDANFESDIEAVAPGQAASLRSDFPGVNFKKVTDFIELPAGTYDLKVKLKGTSNVLLTVPTVPLEAGKIYTMVARGYLYKANASGVFILNNKSK